MTAHENSGPPSPPASPPARTPAGRMAALPSAPDREPTDERALRIALDTRDEHRELAEMVGSPPNPVTGARAREGTLWHAVVTIGEKIDRLVDAVKDERTAAARDREAQARVEAVLEKRREPVAKLWWLLVAGAVALGYQIAGRVLDRVLPSSPPPTSQQPR